MPTDCQDRHAGGTAIQAPLAACFTPPEQLIRQPLQLWIQRHLLPPGLGQRALPLLHSRGRVDAIVGAGPAVSWQLSLATQAAEAKVGEFDDGAGKRYLNQLAGARRPRGARAPRRPTAPRQTGCASSCRQQPPGSAARCPRSCRQEGAGCSCACQQGPPARDGTALPPWGCEQGGHAASRGTLATLRLLSHLRAQRQAAVGTRPPRPRPSARPQPPTAGIAHPLDVAAQYSALVRAPGRAQEGALVISCTMPAGRRGALARLEARGQLDC